MPKGEYRFRSKARVSHSDVQDADAFAIKIVAVAGVNNEWCAYVAPSCWTDHQVASQGDKIDPFVAMALFYVMVMSGRFYRT